MTPTIVLTKTLPRSDPKVAAEHALGFAKEPPRKTRADDHRRALSPGTNHRPCAGATPNVSLSRGDDAGLHPVLGLVAAFDGHRHADDAEGAIGAGRRGGSL